MLASVGASIFIAVVIRSHLLQGSPSFFTAETPCTAWVNQGLGVHVSMWILPVYSAGHDWQHHFTILHLHEAGCQYRR